MLLKEVVRKEWRPALMLLALSMAAYGMLLVTPGLFGDDPDFLYTYYRFGAQGYQAYLGWQRPYAAYLYQVITPVFRLNIHLYELTTTLLRWLSAWLLFLNIRKALPKSESEALWTAALFVIYPGFLQQPIALEYLPHFFALSTFLGSLLLMQLALDAPTKIRCWALSALSLVLMLGMFSIEYFVGLELVRPLLIWARLPKDKPLKKRASLLLKRWLPYLLVLAFYLYWHLVVFTSKKYQPTLLETMWTDPAELLHLLIRILHDLWLASFQVLGNLLNVAGGGRIGVLSIGAGLVTSALLFIFLLFRQQKENETCSAKGAAGLSGLGLLVMLAGGPPIWFADIPMTLAYPWDRTTLVLVIGVCLMWVGILYLLPRVLRNVLFSAIIGLSVAFHIQNNNSFLREWHQVREIFWQLSWRAPDIEPGTMVMFDGLPTIYYPSNSYTPLMNWTYDPAASGQEQNYKFIEISQRLGNVLPSLDPQLPVTHGSFTGNTSRSIVVFKTSSGCLHVLRPQDRYYRDNAPTLNQAMLLTDENLIIPNPARPAVPPAFMGPEPEHGWCYFLQKADLARQQADWGEIDRLASEVDSLSLTPPAPFDWSVFVEAYARLGDFDTAAVYLARVASQPPYYDPALCAFIMRVADEAPNGEVLLTEAAREGCGL